MKLIRVLVVVSTLIGVNAVQANVWDDIKNYFQGTVDSAKAQAAAYGLKKIIQSNISLFAKPQPSVSDVSSFVTGYGYANTLLKSLTGIQVPAEVAALIPTVLKYVAFLKPLYNQLVNNPDASQKVVQFINWVKENSGELKNSS